MKSVLVIGAHPDDETMLVGGTIALLSSRGIKVHILCATRGEGGELGDPPVCAREDAGRVREIELMCAGSALGAASVSVLGYVDPLVGPGQELFPFEADFDTLTGQILTVIQQTGADVVLTHGQDGEYGHPAHKLLHRAARAAVTSCDTCSLFYTFAAHVPGIDDHIWNKSDPAHLALDVRPWLDAKVTAAECHRSQHGLFLRRHKRQSLRDAARKTESFRRQMPPAQDDDPQDDFADLLRASGAWKPDHDNTA